MSEVVPGASVPEYPGNPSGNTPGSDAPGSDAPDQRPALSPQSTAAIAAAKKRRRGRRGGRNRNRTSASGTRTQSSDANRVENDSVESDDVMVAMRTKLQITKHLLLIPHRQAQ